MFSVVLCFVFLVLAVAIPKLVPTAVKERLPGFVLPSVRVVFGLVAVFLAAGTSIIHVPADKVGHLTKVYGINSLESGRVVGYNGEKGFQAQTIPPGIHFIPFVTVLNDFQTFPMVTIPAGYYGRLIAKDGAPLDAGEVMAQAWSDTDYEKYLNAEYFLRNGGQKGLQATVLKPGTYPLNLYLFNVRIGVGETEDVVYDARYSDGITREQSPFTSFITRIPAGNVGVVKSNIQERNITCNVIDRAATQVEGALSVKLVPKGCRGIWAETLQPGDYYLNRDAYDITLVDTRVQTWEYKGGFTKRIIDLNVDQAGNITQTPRSVDVPYDPKVHADQAVFVKVEGWDVPQELRVLVQVTPENAPVVVASVGGLKQIEDSVLTPAIRSIVRNVAGSTITYDELDQDGNKKKVTRATRVNDLINNRNTLERNVEDLIRIEGMKAGVDIKEIRFGEPAIPPELLVAFQREQLAGQLSRAYQEEKKAQTERQATEQARATAEQQKDLVRAQIAVQQALQLEKQREAEGRAEKAYLELLAAGQREQAEVLGRENVLMLNITKEVLATLKEKPELVGVVGKLVPQVYVSGGGGLEGAAGVFGTLFGGKQEKK